MELKHGKVKNHFGSTVNCSYRDFNNIQEFVQYIEDTPLNDIFRWEKLGSTETGQYSWYQTSSYEDAQDKLKNGDKKIAERLTGQLKVEKHAHNMMVQKPSYGVAGYQASVPRYLQGIPTNMINKKAVIQKQRVVTITKNIGYFGVFSGEDIIKEAIKAVQLINTIEAHGIRCNLYVTSIAEAGGTAVGFRVKIKSANERMNISKLAFPLANPSMLRRFSFRYREIAPETTNSFKYGYGSSCQPDTLFSTKAGEYFLPTMLEEADIEELINKIVK
jgi:hypothetical protein